MSFLRLARPSTVSKLTPKIRYFATTTRKMSDFPTTPGKHEFLVHIPDRPNSLQNRLSVRATHLANITPRVQSGQVVLGGATLAKPVQEGESPEMTGSFMIIKADSEEQVRKMLESDVYVSGGAWDVENMKIWNFKSAVRTAL
jgi:uncharacterized protein